MHRVDDHGDAGIAEPLDVDQSLHLLQVRRRGIEPLDQSASLESYKGLSPDAVILLNQADAILEIRDNLGASGARVIRLVLEAIPVRIVTGGDDDGAARLFDSGPNRTPPAWAPAPCTMRRARRSPRPLPRPPPRSGQSRSGCHSPRRARARRAPALSGSPRPPAAQARTLGNVNSSAMMARHPSVPNSIFTGAVATCPSSCTSMDGFRPACVLVPVGDDAPRPPRDRR